MYCAGPVGVVDQPGQPLPLPAAGPDRQLQRLQHQPLPQRVGYLPAQDPPGEGVGDEGGVGEAAGQLDVGDVGDPQPVRRLGGELAADQVRPFVGAGRLRAARLAPAPHRPGDVQLPHQPGHPVPADRDTVAVQHPPDLLRPVDLNMPISAYRGTR